MTNNPFTRRNLVPDERLADSLRDLTYQLPIPVNEKRFDNEDLRIARKRQYFRAFGINDFNCNAVLALGTQLGFIYFGGLIQARKQFIPGWFFFRNSHYNWIRGGKYMFIGATIGAFFMTFNFGQPYFWEDIIRNKLRSITKMPYIEQGFTKYYIHEFNKVPVKDPFSRFEDD